MNWRKITQDRAGLNDSGMIPLLQELSDTKKFEYIQLSVFLDLEGGQLYFYCGLEGQFT